MVLGMCGLCVSRLGLFQRTCCILRELQLLVYSQGRVLWLGNDIQSLACLCLRVARRTDVLGLVGLLGLLNLLEKGSYGL